MEVIATRLFTITISVEGNKANLRVEEIPLSFLLYYAYTGKYNF
jgi:hypothetical protein